MASGACRWLHHPPPMALRNFRNPTTPTTLHTIKTRIPRLQQHCSLLAPRTFTTYQFSQQRSAFRETSQSTIARLRQHHNSPAARPVKVAQPSRQRHNFPAARPVTAAQRLRQRCPLARRPFPRKTRLLNRRRVRMGCSLRTRRTQFKNDRDLWRAFIEPTVVEKIPRRQSLRRFALLCIPVLALYKLSANKARRRDWKDIKAKKRADVSQHAAFNLLLYGIWALC